MNETPQQPVSILIGATATHYLIVISGGGPWRASSKPLLSSENPQRKGSVFACGLSLDFKMKSWKEIAVKRGKRVHEIQTALAKSNRERIWLRREYSKLKHASKV